VQPGFLFDLPTPPRVAVSLLTPEDRLDEGMTRVVRCVEEVLAEA
jgi:hypothetical protein